MPNREGDVNKRFGNELRRMRTQASMSLTAFARMVHYSTGYLSKVENGIKPPSLDLARACDTVLGARGTLISLLMPADMQQSTEPLTPLLLGAVTSPDLATAYEVMTATRRLARSTAPNLMGPIIVAQYRAAHDQATTATGPIRVALVRLTGWLAELAGWAAQEAGTLAEARRWTTLAADLAHSISDDELAAYARVRLAMIAIYAREPETALLLVAGLRGSPWLMLNATLRAAQAHAMLGVERESMAAIDQATRLAVAEPAGPDGLSTLGMGMVGLTHGWCLHDLDRPAEAATHLAAVSVLHTSPRSLARSAARLALTRARLGDTDGACAQVDKVLDTAAQVNSAGAWADLAGVARIAATWPQSEIVRTVRRRLAPVLPRMAT